MKNIIKLFGVLIVTSLIYLLIPFLFQDEITHEKIAQALVFGIIWTIIEGYKLYRKK